MDRYIQKGEWTEIDPVISFTIKSAGKEISRNKFPIPVDVGKYRIMPGGEL
jgi:hypothetical protein